MLEIINVSILAILLIGMFIYHVIMVKELNKQILELTKVHKAKNLTEYAISENIKVEEKELTPPDFLPAENVADNVFDRMIKRQLGEEEDALR